MRICGRSERTIWLFSRQRCVPLPLSLSEVLLTNTCKQPEDIAPYLIPPLGKHYLDKWEEEDSELPGSAPHHPHHRTYASPLEPPVLPRLRPDALTEDALATENVFLGPLSERLMAALAVDESGGGDDDYGLMPLRGEDGPVPPKLPMDAVDLEERIKRELRFIGILPDEEVRSLSSLSFLPPQPY